MKRFTALKLFVFAIFAGPGAYLATRPATLNHPVQAKVQQADADKEKEEADGPQEAFEWRRLSEVDENGRIAPGAREKALRQRDIVAANS